MSFSNNQSPRLNALYDTLNQTFERPELPEHVKLENPDHGVTYSLTHGNRLEKDKWLLQSPTSDPAQKLDRAMVDMLDQYVTRRRNENHYIDIMHLGNHADNYEFQEEIIAKIAEIVEHNAGQWWAPTIIVRYLEGNQGNDRNKFKRVVDKDGNVDLSNTTAFYFAKRLMAACEKFPQSKVRFYSANFSNVPADKLLNEQQLAQRDEINALLAESLDKYDSYEQLPQDTQQKLVTMLNGFMQGDAQDGKRNVNAVAAELWTEAKKNANGKQSSSNILQLLGIDWFLAMNFNTLFLWNHAKIFAIDGRAVITGGQNFWNDYRDGIGPHDVSIRVEGETAMTAHRFADRLWHALPSNYFYSRPAPDTQQFAVGTDLGGEQKLQVGLPVSFERFLQGRPPIPPSSNTVPVMAVANLGLSGSELLGRWEYPAIYQVFLKHYLPKDWLQPSNFEELDVPGSSDRNVAIRFGGSYPNTRQASTFARNYLIAQAESEILLSQQKLVDNDVKQELGFQFWDMSLIEALVDALVRGVKVSIVLSPHGGGYGGALRQGVLYEFLTQLAKEKAEGEFAGGLSVRVVDGSTSGHDGFNHAKVYCIDRKLFYVGSDNAYPAYLQEFGCIVEDDVKTAEFIEQYWDKLKTRDYRQSD